MDLSGGAIHRHGCAGSGRWEDGEGQREMVSKGEFGQESWGLAAIGGAPIPEDPRGGCVLGPLQEVSIQFVWTP